MQDIMPSFVRSGDPLLFRRKSSATNAAGIDENRSILAAETIWIQAAVPKAGWAGDSFLRKIAILRGKAACLTENCVHRYGQLDISPLHSPAIFFQNAFASLFYRSM